MASSSVGLSNTGLSVISKVAPGRIPVKILRCCYLAAAAPCGIVGGAQFGNVVGRLPRAVSTANSQ
jgi:hypothetical protein